MVIYFSGTGNSRYTAKLIANQLQDTLYNAADDIKAGRRGAHESDTPWVFVTPVYAWQIPHIFETYIREATFQGSKKAYFVLTCGSDIGNADAGAQKICADKGWTFCGMREIIMPENYIAMFQAPEREEACSIIDKARPDILNAAELIASEASFPARRITPLDHLKSGPVNKLFYPMFVHAKEFYAKSTCIGCGKCVEVCSLNNVQLQSGKPVWADNCTHCMACICLCPVSAIEYGKKSVGKPRYQCPF